MFYNRIVEEVRGRVYSMNHTVYKYIIRNSEHKY